MAENSGSAASNFHPPLDPLHIRRRRPLEKTKKIKIKIKIHVVSKLRHDDVHAPLSLAGKAE
jgi:hypothetical protein